jgi:tRNA(Arg) A34 adenosine deaminase TadA
MPTTTLKHFSYQHLPPTLQLVSKPLHDLARQMEELVLDGPEKSAGMRKLLEAKDCFVRACIVQKDDKQEVARQDALTEEATRLSHHIEMMASAFLKETKLAPEDAILCTQQEFNQITNIVTTKYWFESRFGDNEKR